MQIETKSWIFNEMTLMTVELSLTRSLIVPTGRMDLQKKLFASIQLVGFFTPCSIQTMN
jgi:hypothetical protein